MWGIYRLLAPGTALSPEYHNLKNDAPYPATVPVDALSTGHRVAVTDVMEAHRNHYEGTGFALTGGMASGPYGNPNRDPPGPGEQAVHGNWERAISIQRTSDSYVVQARSWLPDAIGGCLWFGPHTPHATTYTPFAVGMTSLPRAFSYGHQGALDKTTAFWKIRYVAQAMSLKFNYTRGDVKMTQQALFARGLATQVDQEMQWSRGAGSVAALTTAFHANARHMVEVYGELFDQLMFK